jgi:hypothetical protein
MVARAIMVSYFLLFTFYFLLEPAHTQTPGAPRGVIQLQVRFKPGGVPKELQRKRFFLIKGTQEENKDLIATIKQTPPMSRECYYLSKGASPALIKWLDDYGCDSVYCHEIEKKYLSGSDAVPEFRAAYNQGLLEFKTPELAQRWLTVNLRANIRDGFYLQKQQAITDLIKQAEGSTRTTVRSVMTDRTGTAYLTDIEPGTYTITNLVGIEFKKNSILWVCEKNVTEGTLSAGRTNLILSNEKDPNVTCEIVKRSLPDCERTAK